MVENLTKIENEVKDVESEMRITEEDIEKQLKLQLPKIMMNPSDSCIDRILNYSKSVENQKA